MAFDASTATPVSSAFDPSTAAPISSRFDPSTAALSEADTYPDQVVEPPDPDPYGLKAAAAYGERQGQDIPALLAAQPPWARTATETLAEKMKGLVPTSLGQAGEMAGQLVQPITSEDVGTAKKLYDLSQGAPLSQVAPQGKSYPEFTPEDWGRFGGEVGFDALMAATLAHGMQPRAVPEVPSEAGIANALARGAPQPEAVPLPEAMRAQQEAGLQATLTPEEEDMLRYGTQPQPTTGEQYASQITSPEGIPSGEVRPGVVETPPLRQPGEIAPIRQPETIAGEPVPEQAAPEPASEIAGLDPAFSDIHAAAEKAALNDAVTFDPGEWRKSPPAGQPGSVMRKQWDLAYDAKINEMMDLRAKQRLMAQSPLYAGREQPVEIAPEPTEPPPEIVKAKRRAPVADQFATEITPVSSAIIDDLGGLVSKSQARKLGRYEGNTALWDDTPSLSHPTHNKIYNVNGQMPDVAASELYDMGVLPDPDVNTMYRAIERESQSARTIAKSERQTNVDAKAAEKAAKQASQLELAQPESVVEQQARLEQEAMDRANREAQLEKEAQVQFGWQQPLTGTTGDLGRMDMLGSEDLFAQPSTYADALAKSNAASAEFRAAADAYRARRIGDEDFIAAKFKHDTAMAEFDKAFAAEQARSSPEVATSPETPEAQGNLFGTAGIERAGEAAGIPLIRKPRPIPPGPNEPNPVAGSGKFRMSYNIDKELGDRMEGIGASKESGFLKAEIAARNVLSDLTPKQEGELGQYLVSQRLKEVNPLHPQILPNAELRRISSDPAIKQALQTYKTDVKPDIEALRKRAGLTEEAAAGKAPEFISLIPETDELLPGTLPPQVRAGRISRTTIFNQQAKGNAKSYTTNLRDILNRSYSEVIRKARTNEFYQAVKRKGLSDTLTYEDLPQELQHDFRAATEPELQPSGILMKAGRAFQKVTTAGALTGNPPELLNHMRRQLNLVSARPPVGQGLAARLEAVVPYIGPKVGTALRAVTEDMSLPENQAILQDIFDAGGGSARSFIHRYQTRLPGVSQLQHATQNLLFAIPRGRGVGGWDLRMRVQLEKIRRAVEGDVDPQRIRENSNQIGQYGAHPDWIIRFLRAFNPYAATTATMRLTELKTAVGVTGMKSGMMTVPHMAETVLRSAGGTILGLSTANYLLSGHFPWNNDKGHEFDLDTGIRDSKGNRIYVSLRAIAPELSRVVNTLSLPELMRETTAKHPQYGSATMTGPANQIASLITGPAQNAMLTALTGKVPYFLKRPGEAPELMDIAKLKKGEAEAGDSRAWRQIKAALSGVNPVGRAWYDPKQPIELPSPLNYIEQPIPGVRPLGNVFTQSYEPKQRKVRPQSFQQDMRDIMGTGERGRSEMADILESVR